MQNAGEQLRHGANVFILKPHTSQPSGRLLPAGAAFLQTMLGDSRGMRRKEWARGLRPLKNSLCLPGLGQLRLRYYSTHGGRGEVPPLKISKNCVKAQLPIAIVYSVLQLVEDVKVALRRIARDDTGLFQKVELEACTQNGARGVELEFKKLAKARAVVIETCKAEEMGVGGDV